jgi:hypothetical protein
MSEAAAAPNEPSLQQPCTCCNQKYAKDCNIPLGSGCLGLPPSRVRCEPWAVELSRAHIDTFAVLK